MKLNKENFDLLIAGDITVKQRNDFISLIDDRFNHIFSILTKESQVDWYDYDNGYTETSGRFDESAYREYIGIDGDFVWKVDYSDFFNEKGAEFPTRWLWEDDASIIQEITSFVKKHNESLAKKKKIAKSKREAKKIEKASVKKSIESKLTANELRYIKFK